MIQRLVLTEIDRRRLEILDGDDPGIRFACEQTLEQARLDWERATRPTL